MPEFYIGNRAIGNLHPPVVIAEIGINHEGSIDTAIAMADAAINAGAEIIKHQTHIPEDEMSSEAKYIIPDNADVSIYEVISRCALNESEEFKLMQHIESRGSIFLSTPFSRAAAQRLINFNVKAFKIGSGECNNYPLVEYIASAGKPVILSTGMNSLDTIFPSVEILRRAKVPFALLHCTNIYPTPPKLVRLGALSQLRLSFPDAVIGLSDHTVNNFACLGASALGASILERHFTDSKDRNGPDIICSMDPKDLKDLIIGSHSIFESSGGSKVAAEEEGPTIAFAFASVVAEVDLHPGDTITESNISLKRPSGGDFSASDYKGLLGGKIQSFVKSGTQLKKNSVKINP